MLVSIHLVARLLRVPLLRLDGHVLLVDDDLRTTSGRPVPPSVREDLSAGRLLALAEAELAAIEGRRPRGR